MRRLLVPIAASVLLGAALEVSATAREVLVRAGEHPNFSRVVLETPPIDGWRVERDKRRVRIYLPKPDAKFNTRAIFPDRRVSRVAGAAAEPAAGGSWLALNLSCDCEIKAFAHQNRKIVVDIFDRAARETAAPESESRSGPATDPGAIGWVEAALSGTGNDLASGMNGAPIAASDRPAQPPDTVAPSHSPAPRPARRIGPVVALSDMAKERAAVIPDPAPPESEATAPQPPRRTTASLDPDAVETVRARLLDQLRRAMAQGLIEPVDARPGLGPEAPGHAVDEAATSPEPESEGPQPLGDRRAEASGERALPRTQADESLQPLSAATAVDLAAAAQSARAVKPSPPENCVDESVLNIAAWGGGGSAYPHWDAKLIGEFDRPDPDAALRLARAYLSIGFGLEAAEALKALAPDSPDRAIVNALARMVDGFPPDEGHPFSAGECGKRHLLWRATAAGLSSPQMTGRFDEDGDDAHRIDAPKPILAALAELPGPLRTRAGVPMAVALLNAGDVEGAYTALQIIERAGEPPEPRELYVRALVAVAQEDQARAEELFRRAAVADDPSSPLALLAWLRAAEKNGWPEPDRLSERLAEARNLYRGSPLGLRLAIATAQSDVRRGEIGPAVDLLAKRHRDVALDQHRAALAEAARMIARRYRPDPDRGAAYLKAMLRAEALIGEAAAADPVRAAVAARAVELGAPGFADRYLAPSLVRRAPEVMRAKARSALARRRPSQALMSLKGLRDAESASLRAAAYAEIGDFGNAFKSVRLAGDMDAAERYAWLARDWSAAAASLDEEKAAAATRRRRALSAFMWSQQDRPSAEAALEASPHMAAFLPPDLDALSAGDERTEPTLAAASGLVARARDEADFLREVLDDG